MSEEPEQGKSGRVETSRERVSLENASPEGPERADRAAPRRHGWAPIWLGTLALLLMLALLGVGRYVENAEFHERARQFAIAQIELATGGRVELKRVEWNLAQLQFELGGLTIHGKEAATEAPLLQAERVRARVKWAWLLRGRV